MKVGGIINKAGRCEMSLLRERVDSAMKGLGEDASMEDLMYRLYVLDRIERSEQEAEKDGTKTAEELRREVASW